jgi:hypothetical protein
MQPNVAMQPKEYLVAFDATSMETRTRMLAWLRRCNAVHVMRDVWLLRDYYRMAGDINYELTKYEPFDGKLLVLGLNQTWTDWTYNALPDAAAAWLRENLKE